MSTVVSIPPTSADAVYSEAGRETFFYLVKQYVVGLLQKRAFGGQMTVDASAVSTGYVDVAFSGDRIDANYVPSGEIVKADGSKSVVDIDYATRAVGGFRVYVGEVGTLYWKITPYE